MISDRPLEYATRESARPVRRHSRLAWAALAAAVLTTPPLTFAAFRLAADARIVDQHLLCCRAPALGAGVFVGLPVAAVFAAGIALARTLRSGGTLAGRGASATGLFLALVSVVAGVLLAGAIRA